MALKFKCERCGEYIITKFFKVGEVAKCRICGAENRVPENATETGEEPKYTAPTDAEPEAVTGVKEKVRSVGEVLGLSIVTFSIYFWVYLFKTLREMRNAFTFDAQEINPDKIRPILIVYLIVSILVAFIDEVFVWPLGARGYTSMTAGLYAWLVVSTFSSTAIFIAFWLSFVKLIEVCQKKGGVVSLNKSIFWALIVINGLMYLVFIGTTSLLSLVLIVYLVVSLLLLYLTVKQVNRIWEESRGIGIS